MGIKAAVESSAHNNLSFCLGVICESLTLVSDRLSLYSKIITVVVAETSPATRGSFAAYAKSNNILAGMVLEFYNISAFGGNRPYSCGLSLCCISFPLMFFGVPFFITGLIVKLHIAPSNIYLVYIFAFTGFIVCQNIKICTGILTGGSGSVGAVSAWR